MWAIGSHKAKVAPVPARPVLDLSGPKLRRAFENLVESAEDTGGVERYVGALALKASLFEEVLGKGQVGELTEPEFYDLAAFITPVRRRIGAWLGRNGFAAMRGRLVALARRLVGYRHRRSTARRVRRQLSRRPRAPLVARSRRRGAALHRARALSADDALDVGRARQHRRAARNLAQRQ